MEQFLRRQIVVSYFICFSRRTREEYIHHEKIFTRIRMYEIEKEKKKGATPIWVLQSFFALYIFLGMFHRVSFTI